MAKMEKYNEITTHLINGNPLLGTSFKISPIVDSNKKRTSVSSDTVKNTPFSNGHTSNRSVISDLIPYPASSISTTIERKDGSLIDQQENFRPYNTNKQIILKSKKTKLLNQNSTSFDINSSLNVDNNQQTTTELDFSSQKGNSIEINFDTENIVRIVKLLSEKKESFTQTEHYEQCNQYVQANIAIVEDNEDPNKLDLNRSNQTLRSQLDQLSYVIEEMSKERSNTNLQMHSLQKLIKVKELQIEEINAEKEKHLADNDELRFAIKNIETLITDYQKNLLGKNAENEELRKELKATNFEKNNLLSQINQFKTALQSKEELAKELSHVTSANQEEILTLKSHYQAMVEQLNRTNADMQNLLGYKTMLEQRLLSFSNDPFQSQPNPSQSTSQAQRSPRLTDKTFVSNVTNLKAKCALLKQSWQQTRHVFVNKFNQFNNEYESKCAEILEKIEANVTKHSDTFNKLVQTESEYKQCQSDIDRLSKENQRVDKLNQQLKESNAVKEQSIVKLGLIQTENFTLKQVNEALEQQVVLLKNDSNKFQNNSVQLLSQLEKIQTEKETIETELKNVKEEMIQLKKWKEDKNSVDHELHQENKSLKEEIVQLKNDNQFKDRWENQLIEKEKELEQKRTELEKLQNQFEQITKRLEVEISIKEGTINEKQQLLINLTEKQEKISNLSSNINILTRRNRELTDQLKNTQEQSLQSAEEVIQLKQRQTSFEQMQNAVSQKDTVITNLNEQLARLSAQCEQSRLTEQELQTKFDSLVNQVFPLKDQAESDNNNEFKQTISALQNDLVKEKDRSKGLSQSLFNEKRANSRMKKELTQYRTISSNDNVVSEGTSSSTTINEMDGEKLFELDPSQLRLRLMAKVTEVKQLYAALQSQRLVQLETGINCYGDSNEYPSDSLEDTLAQSLSTEEKSSLCNDFIIQMLQDLPDTATSDETSQLKPLGNLHSSIEDLKQELNSLKQSLTNESNFSTSTPNVNCSL